MTQEKHKNTVRRFDPNFGVNLMLAVYSIGHFLVDMCCCAAMLTFTRGSDYFALSLLIYNFCAFALQMPIGAAADHFNHTGGLSVFGCLTIAAAMLASPAPLVLSALLGIGNACYHVGGGVFALRSDRRCTRLGVFVSPGAVGLFIGRCAVEVFGCGGTFVMISTAALMIICMIFILLIEPISDTYESVSPFPHGLSVSYPLRDFIACVCFFIVVCLRSFGGGEFNFEWRVSVGIVAAGALLAVSAAIGKAAGGIIADNLGMKAAASTTLLISSFLMLFSGYTVPAAAAVIAFNMTMPMTLRAASDIYEGREGFSFGLMTFGLFLGYLPVFFGVALPFGIYGNAAVPAVSLAIMAAGLELTSKRTDTI